MTPVTLAFFPSSPSEVPPHLSQVNREEPQIPAPQAEVERGGEEAPTSVPVLSSPWMALLGDLCPRPAHPLWVCSPFQQLVLHGCSARWDQVKKGWWSSPGPTPVSNLNSTQHTASSPPPQACRLGF